MTITVTGLEEATRRLGKDLRPAIRRAALAIGEVVRGKIAVYPAQRSPTNPQRWYQRGYGSKWRRKDGSVGGRATSEQLGQRWTTQPKGDGAVVGTPVSYAPWVQKEDQQAAVHRSSGWVTDVEVAEDVVKSGQVERIVEDAVVGELGGG